MRSSYKKLFYNKERLYKLINLRLIGYSHTSLALIFACDISSVRHQCDKYMVFPEGQVYSIERILTDILPNFLKESDPFEKIKWEKADGTRYSMGKSYSDYLRDAGYPHKKPPVD